MSLNALIQNKYNCSKANNEFLNTLLFSYHIFSLKVSFEIVNHSDFSFKQAFASIFHPPFKTRSQSARARRGQWPRTPPVYQYERSAGARPPWPRWASVWRGGLGSAASRGIDRIKLDLSEINTKERRATHTSRRGRGCEIRWRNISQKNKKLELFPPSLSVYLYLKLKRTTVDFFSPSQRR